MSISALTPRGELSVVMGCSAPRWRKRFGQHAPLSATKPTVRLRSRPCIRRRMSLPFVIFSLATAQPFTCNAIALHDVDGPIHCADGRKIRLQGIGATEMDGTCRPNQPCLQGDPRTQRRAMATRVIGARISREDKSIYGQVWFLRPVALTCTPTGKSHARVTAWCRRQDGADLSCEAMRAGVAARWATFDRGGRLLQCTGPTAEDMVRQQMEVGRQPRR